MQLIDVPKENGLEDIPVYATRPAVGISEPSWSKITYKNVKKFIKNKYNIFSNFWSSKPLIRNWIRIQIRIRS